MTPPETPYTPFSISVVPRRDEAGVVVAGDLDMSTADEVAQAVGGLWRAGCGRVVLDLSRVDLIDSTALRVLLTLRNAAKREGRGLALVPARPGAQRIFRITATEGLFDWRARFAA